MLMDSEDTFTKNIKLFSLFELKYGQFRLYTTIHTNCMRVSNMDKYVKDSKYKYVGGYNLVVLRCHGRFDTCVISKRYQKGVT